MVEFSFLIRSSRKEKISPLLVLPSYFHTCRRECCSSGRKLLAAQQLAKGVDNTDTTETLSRHTRLPQQTNDSAPGAIATNEAIADEEGIMV